MRVIVTRPAAQAEGWVAQLREAGHDAVALPLIEIAALADPAPLAAAWSALAAYRLVVFVSPNAAACFLAARPEGCGWPAATLAGAVGPGTTAALRAAGVPAQAIVEPAADAPQFDSEALWARLAAHAWSGRRVLIVRGDGGRDWLTETLRSEGAEVEALAAYRRCLPRLGAAQRALLDAALRAPHEHLWLFSSSEAIANLAELAGAGAAWADARAIASHERIAARARALGMREVALARPTLAAMSACIQSMAP